MKNNKTPHITEVSGKFNNAKIFTDVVEEKAIAQIKAICDTSAFSQSKIRVMPDVHAGKGCTIGTTMTIVDKIVPNMVGVDIGCGMELAQLKQKDIDLCALDEFIHKNIPSGMSCRSSAHKNNENIDLTQLRCKDHLDLKRAKNSLGTLGGGNHFIELDKDDDGNIYIVIHSGSRHLGKEVAEFYQAKAIEVHNKKLNDKMDKVIATLKAEGRFSEIADTIKCIKAETEQIPDEMMWVEGDLFDDYIHDMKIVQKFALWNRKTMVDVIVEGLGLEVVDGFTCIHNYIDTDNFILRKGAVSAQKGEKILIPINMRDGSFICLGKGNPDWNFSAPHGAGRIMSRRTAVNTLSLDEYVQEMKGIYSTSVGVGTLDESPMAYKSVDDILNNIEPTAEVVKQIKPIYNFKANE